ncbi:MAG TPA: peptidoglycan bridge formation glycyltransferase FemA/FemB family protein [Anaerolineales bacterium]
MPEVSLEQWNEYIQALPDVHFLQTGEWGELKSRFGWTAARLIVGSSGVQVLFRQLPLGFTLAYVPKRIASQIAAADADPLWNEVDVLCRKRGAILCKDEPDAWIEGDASKSPSGLIQTSPRLFASHHNIQPRRTILVDLHPSEDEILARMKQKCRYNIRLSSKKGVTVRPWEDISGFHAMMTTTGARDGFAAHSEAYYAAAHGLFHARGRCELLLAEHEGRPLASLMVFARGRRAWYVYGASTDTDRERMPNYLLQWEAMRWARDHGCEEYDLWGVPDEDESALEAAFEDRNDGLWGVYRFKRGFGGELRRAAQAVDRVYNPLLYRLYLLRTSAPDAA